MHAGRGFVAAPRPPGPSWPVTGAQASAFGPAPNELVARPRVVVYWPHRALSRGPAVLPAPLEKLRSAAVRRSTPRDGHRVVARSPALTHWSWH